MYEKGNKHIDSACMYEMYTNDINFIFKNILV